MMAGAEGVSTDMVLLGHATEADVLASANHLRTLGARARTLLADCVEHQGVTRSKVSQAANQLSDAGFAFVTESLDLWSKDCEIRPSLAGEEALEVLERLESIKKN